jgi:hypothetical protein
MHTAVSFFDPSNPTYCLMTTFSAGHDIQDRTYRISSVWRKAAAPQLHNVRIMALIWSAPLVAVSPVAAQSKRDYRPRTPAGRVHVASEGSSGVRVWPASRCCPLDLLVASGHSFPPNETASALNSLVKRLCLDMEMLILREKLSTFPEYVQA